MQARQAQPCLLNDLQAADLDVTPVSARGLRDHHRRRIDAPHLSGRKGKEQRLEADARTASELDNARGMLCGAVRDGLDHPAVERCIPAGHGSTDQPPYQSPRVRELPTDDAQIAASHDVWPRAL